MSTHQNDPVLHRILLQLELLAHSLADEARCRDVDGQRRDDEVATLRAQVQDTLVAIAKLPAELTKALADRLRSIEFWLQRFDAPAAGTAPKTVTQPLTVEVRGTWSWDTIRKNAIPISGWVIATVSTLVHLYHWLAAHFG
jgi:hypothetical protein